MIIEIRAAEGGEHAKRLVLIQVGVYSKLLKRHHGL